jgi:N-acetylneuraminate synthase
MTPFIVAEMSANHLGDRDRAFALVEAARAAGADAIKLQTWTPGSMCLNDYRLDRGPWKGRLLRELYAEAHTPWEWHGPLFDFARKLGIIPFSAAFDRGAVDFLERLGVDRHKVASFELTDLPLIRYMASKGKPLILSTGMASEREINDAWRASVEARSRTWLLCTSAYPADASDANLATLHNPCWGAKGISDHTMGSAVAVAATAMGAVMIEKHLTLSRADGGLDAGFSMEPHEFKQMVQDCRRAKAAIGQLRYGCGPDESTELRRSLWVSRGTSKGEPLRLHDNVCTARPALGLAPATELTGLRAARNLRAGEPLTQECLT